MSNALARAGVLGSVGLRWLLAALVVLTAICVLVPFSPLMPAAGLDPSWRLGMNQAMAQGLAIGRDIVFTFGPYAPVYTGMYHPATDVMMMGASLYLAVFFGIAAILTFKGGHWALQFGLLALLHLMLVHDPVLFSYPVLVGVYAIREMRSAVDKEERAWRIAGLLCLLLPFGLLPLVKGSVWVLCALVTAVVASLFAAQRHWRLAALTLATPLLSLVLFWIAARQAVDALPNYFASMLPIVSGYSEAMAMRGSAGQVIAYIGAAVFLLSVVVSKERGPLPTKTALVAVFAAALFLGFKGGFVRHDGHAVMAGTLLLIMGLLVAAMYPFWQAGIALFLCFCVWWSIDAAYVRTSTASLLSRLDSTYTSAWKGARLRLVDRDRLPREFEAALAKLRAEAGFPKLAGTSDIYSYEQSYLIASGNRWNPRPVFQSYSAYTPALLEINKEHLLGSHAPDSLIFRVQPLDRRLPPLEDGASWPVILRNYRPAAFKNEFLFLQRRGNTPELAQKPVATGQYALAESVPVPASGAPLFVKIDLRPTALGALAGLLYKPTALQITLTLTNGATRTYQIVSGMARAGFLVSPLIENTTELAFLYAGTEYIDHKTVRSFAIAPVGGHGLWQSRFDVEFTTVSFLSSPDVMRLLDLDRPTPVAATRKIDRAEQCDGVIDIVNGQSPPPEKFATTRLLSVSGWLAISTGRGHVADSTHLLATDPDGRRYLIATRKIMRPDVAAHFSQPSLEASGYSATVDVSGLRGPFTLGLAYEANGKINLCPQFALPGRFGGP